MKPEILEANHKRRIEEARQRINKEIDHLFWDSVSRMTLSERMKLALKIIRFKKPWSKAAESNIAKEITRVV